MNKKGLSEIIATVLIILLAVAAVVIVWQVIKPTLTQTASSISVNCIDVDLAVNSANCTSEPRTLSLTLNKGKISKLKFVFYNANSSKVIEMPAGLNELETKTYSFTSNETELAGINSVNVAGVISDDKGEEQTCSLALQAAKAC